MAKCETCGNDYDKAFEINIGGEKHVFDSFECAIHALAPTCPHCGCRVLGHGVEKDKIIYCCAHCASEAGVTEVRDRA
jgi:nitrite reductase/ring-hydroxylating ferredoxin subunit